MKHGRSAVRASVGGGFEGTPDRLQRSVLKKKKKNVYTFK